MRLVVNVRRVLGRVAEAPWHGERGERKRREERERRREGRGERDRSLCHRPALLSAVGSIGIEPTANEP